MKKLNINVKTGIYSNFGFGFTRLVALEAVFIGFQRLYNYKFGN